MLLAPKHCHFGCTGEIEACFVSIISPRFQEPRWQRGKCWSLPAHRHSLLNCLRFAHTVSFIQNQESEIKYGERALAVLRVALLSSRALPACRVWQAARFLWPSVRCLALQDRAQARVRAATRVLRELLHQARLPPVPGRLKPPLCQHPRYVSLWIFSLCLLGLPRQHDFFKLSNIIFV